MELRNFIKIILREETNVSFPIKLSGSFKVPNNISSRGDALHSFDRRKSDKFGGYMLRGTPIPSKWSSYVKLDQGKGINQVLEELYKKGVSADITELTVDVNDDYSVNWEATIDESSDGKSYVGVASRGSAGGGADSRAEAQIPQLKSKNPKNCNWTEVLDLNVTSPIKIRQFFLKYTLCEEGEEPNDETIEKQNDLEKEFMDWEPGIYKIEGDEDWIYKLNDDKMWEAKKTDTSDFLVLKDSLSSDKYEEALENLKLAELDLGNEETTSLEEHILRIIREETSLQEKLFDKFKTSGLKKTVGSVGGKKNFKKIMKGYDYYTEDILQQILNYELDELRKESEDWGLGEMHELNQLDAIVELRIVNLVKVNNITITVDIHTNTNRFDFDDIMSELRYRLQRNWNDKILLLEGEIWNTSDYGPGVDW